MSASKTEPSVCAVLLTANRPQMTAFAVRCFEAQNYAAKRLLIYDTSDHRHTVSLSNVAGTIVHIAANHGPTVGVLRNLANKYSKDFESDVIVHLDSDDYSHPNRIAEQVALLQSSGADAVGFHEMLFWREPWIKPGPYGKTLDDGHWEYGIPLPGGGHGYREPGEAYLYSQPNPSYALGTSLCYWRKTWERRPFEETSVGEDVRFTSGLKVVSVPGFTPIAQSGEEWYPRMIARIHSGPSGNTSSAYNPESMRRAREWSRVAQWDSYCRSIFEVTCQR